MVLHIGVQNAIEKITNPTWEAVYGALKDINKKEGRTYVKLENPDLKCYVMCYGSKRALFIHHQVPEGQNFILGLGLEKPIETLIQGSSGTVRVQLHEILAVANAYEVFEFFHRSSTIPSRYTLRSLKEEFQLLETE